MTGSRFERAPQAMDLITWCQGSVARRLALAFTILIALFVGLAAFSTVQLRNAGARLQQIVEVNNREVELAGALRNAINELLLETRSITSLSDPKELELAQRQIGDVKARYLKSAEELGSLLQRNDTQASDREALRAIESAANTSLPLLDRVAKEGADGSSLEASLTLKTSAVPAVMVWQQKVGALIALEDTRNRVAYLEAASDQRRALAVNGLLVALSVTMGGILGWRITRSVQRPIAEATIVTERIARGDLTVSVLATRGDDEPARLLRAVAIMQDKLRALTGDIQASSSGVVQASTEVAAANDDLSRRTEMTAAHLEQTSQSLQLLIGRVRQTTEAVAQATELAHSAAEQASRGKERIAKLAEGVAEIKLKSGQVAQSIAVVDEIARRTNLLALNAAVEAAGAGERGRGFAVVAAEVRSLAQRAAEVADEIKRMVHATVAEVESCARAAKAADEAMNGVVSTVTGVSTQMLTIMTASTDQTSDLARIDESVTQLDDATQQNAALVEQTAATARQLEVHARQLSVTVDTFRVKERS